MLFRLKERIREVRLLNSDKNKIRKYLKSGQKPWSYGYNEYKKGALSDVLNDQNIYDLFRDNQKLPEKYGFRIDERIVELPWVISKLDTEKCLLLDAGSALNFKNILDLNIFNSKKVVIYTLSPEETMVRQSNVSYVYGDLRDTILKNNCFDEIVCVSTLEHIGMNNEFLYSNDSKFNECNTDDYKDAIKEFYRLLKPGGRLFVTVPYGKYENIGWLQQFDSKMIETMINVFDGSSYVVTYYKYFNDGWQIIDKAACNDCLYYDVHNSSDYEPDYIAAARAVACVELVK